MSEVTNITPPEPIFPDETGLKHKDFIHVCNQLHADILGVGETVSAFIKAVPDSNGKPMILGYALCISSERLEDKTKDETGIVYLVTARKRLRLFKTIDAIANYLGDNNICNFNVCTIL